MPLRSASVKRASAGLSQSKTPANAGVDEERHDDLRTRCRVADDVIVEGGDVVDHERRAARRGGAADAAPGGQARTRRASAERPEQQLAGGQREIEARPS